MALPLRTSGARCRVRWPGVDAFGGGSLIGAEGPLWVDLFVLLAVAIKLVAQACADTERDRRGAAALGPAGTFSSRPPAQHGT